jgi:hypothetical protein
VGKWALPTAGEREVTAGVAEINREGFNGAPSIYGGVFEGYTSSRPSSDSRITYTDFGSGRPIVPEKYFCRISGDKKNIPLQMVVMSAKN